MALALLTGLKIAYESGNQSQRLKQSPVMETVQYVLVKSLNLAPKFLLTVSSSLETFLLSIIYETEEAYCGSTLWAL